MENIYLKEPDLKKLVLTQRRQSKCIDKPALTKSLNNNPY